MTIMMPVMTIIKTVILLSCPLKARTGKNIILVIHPDQVNLSAASAGSCTALPQHVVFLCTTSKKGWDMHIYSMSPQQHLLPAGLQEHGICQGCIKQCVLSAQKDGQSNACNSSSIIKLNLHNALLVLQAHTTQAAACRCCCMALALVSAYGT